VLNTLKRGNNLGQSNPEFLVYDDCFAPGDYLVVDYNVKGFSRKLAQLDYRA
jgi:hypothetical protein